MVDFSHLVLKSVRNRFNERYEYDNINNKNIH